MASYRSFSSAAVRGVSLSLAASAFLMTGCANNFVTTASSTAAQVQTIGGSLHGGNQAITNASVKLYAAGTTGYGSAGTLLASTTSDSSGGFQFTQVATQPASLSSSYHCPSPNSLIYIIGSGGNTIGTSDTSVNNSSVGLIGAIGACSGVGSIFVNMNEVTTIGSVVALQQYMNPGTSTPGSATIGTSVDYTVASPGQAGIGLQNAFAMVPNLVTLATGTVVNSYTKTGTAAAVNAVTVMATPESTKINTIADIIAACVNQVTATSSTGCSTLFANAVPPSDASVTSQPNATFGTAVDTIQAAYYMMVNPTDGSSTALGNLYVLAVPSSPFQPTISVQPSDWTVAIVYAGNSSSNCTNSQPFIQTPYGLAIDAAGNVWMGNGSSNTKGSIAEMSFSGAPLACSANTGLIRGGIAIDTAGFVWSAGGLASVAKFDGTTLTTIPVTSASTYGMGADGNGNVFFNDQTNSVLYELPSTATASTTPTKIGSDGVKLATQIAVDHNNVVYLAPNSTSLLGVYAPTNPGGTTYPATSTPLSNATNYSAVYGVAIDASNNVWTSNNGTATSPGNTISYTTPATDGASPQTLTFTASTPSTISAGGLSTARLLAIDGAGNVWAPNSVANGNSVYTLSEFSKTGTALSPTVFNGTTNTGGFTKSTAYFNGPRVIAIDFSGNVWAANTQSGLTVVEVLGAAVPVSTPISIQVKNNTLGAKP